MKITMENLNSRVASRVEFFIGQCDPEEIESGSLDTSLGTLTVQFLSGRTYDYAEVEIGLFCELVKAVSFGKFLNEEIKPYYTATETTDPEVVARIVADQQFRKAMKLVGNNPAELLA